MGKKVNYKWKADTLKPTRQEYEDLAFQCGWAKQRFISVNYIPVYWKYNSKIEKLNILIFKVKQIGLFYNIYVYMYMASLRS